MALKRNPSSRPSRVPFGRIGGHLGRKGGQKGCQMEVQIGVSNEATTRFPEKTRTCEFDTLFLMFWPCRASLKNLLLRSCLGYRREVKTEVHKMMPSKATLGGSDGYLGPPRLIFGSPLGAPFGDTI